MRSTRLSLLLATSLFLAAAPVAAYAPTFVAPYAPLAGDPASDAMLTEVAEPLPGLPQAADKSLWCATMASHLAELALEAGDAETFSTLAPLAIALSQHISTLFVALRVGEPDIEGFVDLYAEEIDRVVAGNATERYTPDECKSMVQPGLLA
jgi:hypothetical protein